MKNLVQWAIVCVSYQFSLISLPLPPCFLWSCRYKFPAHLKILKVTFPLHGDSCHVESAHVLLKFLMILPASVFSLLLVFLERSLDSTCGECVPILALSNNFKTNFIQHAHLIAPSTLMMSEFLLNAVLKIEMELEKFLKAPLEQLQFASSMTSFQVSREPWIMPKVAP